MIAEFFSWYLIDTPKKLIEILKNFLKFGIYFFSIPFLLKTLFAHWHKYSWQYPKGFDPGKLLSVWVSNLISRIVGMIARSFLILVGLIFELFVLIFGAMLIFCWIFLPLVWVLILVYGVKFLFSI